MTKVKLIGSKKTTGAKRAKGSKNPGEHTIMYRGVIQDSSSLNEIERFCSVCDWVSTISTSSGGVINAVVPVAPTNAELWTQLIATFDEYRVLAVECKYVPNYSSLPSTLLGGVLGMVVDHDSSSALSSLASGAAYESFQMAPIDRPLVATWRMSTTLEAQYVNSQAAANAGSIKLYASGLTASSNYGTVVVRYRLQFRGLGR